MYIFLIVGFAIVALGWMVYGIWRLKEHIEEKKNPELKEEKETTEHLKKVKSGFEDYMEKMKEFEKKTYDRKDLQR
ncbi:MAG: hypothetical protein ACYS18_03525 [Planctomycetota bacterium]|jgi:hypothetical protein